MLMYGNWQKCFLLIASYKFQYLTEWSFKCGVITLLLLLLNLVILQFLIGVSLSEPHTSRSLSSFCTSHIHTVRAIKYDWQAIQVLWMFRMPCVWTVRMMKYDWQAIQALWTFCMSHVWTVSVERSIKWGKRGLDEQEKMTDLKERETNVERQTRLVNLCCCLHISVMVLHIVWLGKEWMIEIDMQSTTKDEGWEYLQ